jgi:hypothetical protein
MYSVNDGEEVKANLEKLTVISQVRAITRERRKLAKVTYTRDLENGCGFCKRYGSQQKFRALHEFKKAIEERRLRREQMWVNLIKYAVLRERTAQHKRIHNISLLL